MISNTYHPALFFYLSFSLNTLHRIFIRDAPSLDYLTLVGTTKYGNRCNSLNISLL